MKHLLFSTLAACTLISCATQDLELSSPGTPGIIVAHEVQCTHDDGKLILPAGLYQPEAQSAKGIYYVAPTPLTTSGIIRQGHERGGLFIANEGWQWAWIGHPAYEVTENQTSIMGKRGIIMPKHFKFEPYVPFTKAKK